ncbi:hypothetical protein LguiA_005689 [Lonicera macranthoides]
MEENARLRRQQELQGNRTEDKFPQPILEFAEAAWKLEERSNGEEPNPNVPARNCETYQENMGFEN